MSEYSDIQEEKKVHKINTFECKSCGGTAVFDPESQCLKCEYCNSTTEIEKAEGIIEEKDFFSIDEDSLSGDWGVETRVVVCKNCAGETVLEANDLSTRCVFCGSPQVITKDELPGIKPESVLPFKIDDVAAKKLFKEWISKRFWAPRSIKKDHKIDDKLKGLYVPFWTYDADTHSDFNGLAGKYYYVTETYTVMVNNKPQIRTRQVRKTRWFPVSGEYSKFYDDVAINDSTNLDEKIMRKIQPFDLRLLEVYNPAYLVGFAAEKYSKGVVKLWETAKGMISDMIRGGVDSQLLARPGVDVVGMMNINTTYNKITYKHMLLPVWISAYKFRGKVFKFYINGQTGEVQGVAPVSILKVLLAIGITAAVIYLIYLWAGGAI